VLLACGFKIVRLPLGVYDSFAAAGRRRSLRRGARRHRLLRAVPERLVPLRAVRPAGRRRGHAAADVAATPFGSNVALKVVNDYCSQVRTIHPFQRFITQTIHTIVRALLRSLPASLQNCLMCWIGCRRTLTH